MELYKHQQKLLDTNPAMHLLAWGTGTGKTRTALALAQHNCGTVLIVCPKTLKENWRREVVKWLGITPTVFDAKKPAYGAATIISKEEFKKFAEVLPAFDGIIIDEAHTFAGITSQLSKSMMKYLRGHKTKYRWLLTATPFLRNAWNVYVLGKLLGQDWEYHAFRPKFFFEQPMHGRSVWMPRPGMEDDVASLVHQLGSAVKLEDCVDIPDATFEVEYFRLTPAQKTAMKSIKEVLPIVRFTKWHQICGGVLKGNEYEPSRLIDSDKVKRMIELAESNDKLIVSCCYLEEIKMLYEKLNQLGTHKVFTMTGNDKDKQLIIDAFNAAPQAILIVNGKCSEGWQAPTAQTIVFYSYDFSLKNKIQMEGRIRRIDRPQKVTYISLVCEDSIDEAVVGALERKMDFDAAIYNYQIKGEQHGSYQSI